MTNTFIMTWDGNYDTGWGGIARYSKAIRTTAAGRLFREGWSTGVRQHGMSSGDRVYLLRQHTDRGIVGSGRLVDGRIQSGTREWADPLFRGSPAWFVDIKWDRILETKDRLPIEDLINRSKHTTGTRSVHPANVYPNRAPLLLSNSGFLTERLGPPPNSF